MDPYNALQLPKQFTLEQLKQQYKNVAIQFHPDKNRDNLAEARSMFAMVTGCYKKLLQEFKQRDVTDVTDDDDFNAKEFNRVFDENRMPDVNDTGYGDWMNKTIEKSIKTEKEKYIEPVAMDASSSFANVYELGMDHIQDFSGANMNMKSLCFMDVKKAHSTQQIIDPNAVKPRKDYKDVKDIENERAQLAYIMPHAERQKYERHERKKVDREERRQVNIKKRDDEIEHHYIKTKHLLKKV